jgi:hypothetical protein
MALVALFWLSVLSIVGIVLTAAELLRTGLHKRYPWVFAYLIISAPCYAALLITSVNSEWYFFVWAAAEPLTWALYIGMVFELYRLILERHKGLYSVGRWAMYVGMVVSAAVSALALLPRFAPQSPQPSRAMPYLLAGERAVDLSLAILLLLMMFLLSWYAVPLCRNVVVHAVVYTIYFLSITFATLMRVAFGLNESSDAMNLAMTAASTGCILAWFFLLNRKGEEVRVRQPWIGREQEQRILSQLDSMNAALLRPARK